MFSTLTTSAQDITSVEAVLRKGWLAPGDIASEMEMELASRYGFQFSVMVNSRKSALFLILLSIGVNPGTEVLVAKNADPDHLKVLSALKAKLIYYEVDSDKLVISPELLKSAMTPETKAILISNPLQVEQDFTSIQAFIIEDMYNNPSKSKGITASIITFDDVCSFMLFSQEDHYQTALNSRDWGRAGTQNEDVSTRYSGWVLDNVRYDYKFVYSSLGFNFKSCEMAACLARERLNREFNPFALEENANRKLSLNGACALVHSLDISSTKAKLAEIGVPIYSPFSDWALIPLLNQDQSDNIISIINSFSA